jgi:AraC family transcriptional regulator
MVQLCPADVQSEGLPSVDRAGSRGTHARYTLGMTDEQPQLDARIVELTPQPTVAVRVQLPMSDIDLGALFEEHLPNIADTLANLGGMSAGAAYGRYHEWGEHNADVEIGIPVVAPVANLRALAECQPGEICSSELPGGSAAVAVHLGPYDKLEGTYRRLHDWIHEQGHEEGPGPWESYIDDPAEVDDPSELRTEVVWPLG